MRVGTIPLIKDSRGIQTCLVSSTKNPENFTFPKGAVKRGECQIDAALRELREEAGLHGKPTLTQSPIYVRNKKFPENSTLFFFVEVTRIDSSWDEQDTRQRQWAYLHDLEGIPLNKKARKVIKQLYEIGLHEPVKGSPTAIGLKERLKGLLPSFGRNHFRSLTWSRSS